MLKCVSKYLLFSTLLFKFCTAEKLLYLLFFEVVSQKLKYSKGNFLAMYQLVLYFPFCKNEALATINFKSLKRYDSCKKQGVVQ